MCGKKRTMILTEHRVVFFGRKTNVWMRHIGGALATTRHVLGTQLGVSEVRGTQQSRKWPIWARLSMHSDSVFCDG